MLDIDAGNTVELAAAEDRQPIKAFAPYAAHAALDVRVRVRRLDRRPDDPMGCTNTIFLQHLGSAKGEFRSATPSLERDRLSRLMAAALNSHSDTHVLGPAGQSYPTVNL